MNRIHYFRIYNSSCSQMLHKKASQYCRIKNEVILHSIISPERLKQQHANLEIKSHNYLSEDTPMSASHNLLRTGPVKIKPTNTSRLTLLPTCLAPSNQPLPCLTPIPGPQITYLKSGFSLSVKSSNANACAIFSSTCVVSTASIAAAALRFALLRRVSRIRRIMRKTLKST